MRSLRFNEFLLRIDLKVNLKLCNIYDLLSDSVKLTVEFVEQMLVRDLGDCLGRLLLILPALVVGTFLLNPLSSCLKVLVSVLVQLRHVSFDSLLLCDVSLLLLRGSPLIGVHT